MDAVLATDLVGVGSGGCQGNADAGSRQADLGVTQGIGSWGWAHPPYPLTPTSYPTSSRSQKRFSLDGKKHTRKDHIERENKSEQLGDEIERPAWHFDEADRRHVEAE